MSLAQYVSHQSDSELFALIMSERPDEDFVFITKEMVVSHFASQEGVSSLTDGSVNEEVARTSAECHASYGVRGWEVVLQAIDAERFLYAMQKCNGFLGGGQRSDDAASARVVGQGLQKLYALETYSASYFKVYAAFGIVEICVCSIDGDVLQDGSPYAPFDECFVSDSLDTAKEQGMVGYDHVATFCCSLFDYVLRNVKTQ
jgi:hypothetical protein